MTRAPTPADLPPFASGTAPGRVHLRLLQTTDLHCHVWPYDYYADRPADTVGLARTAALIADARAEAQNTLLLDNGDFLQGTPMADHAAFERGLREGDTHPVMAAMNALGFDAATLGNHEFNYGLPFLTKALSGASFPIVSANVVTRKGAAPTRDKSLVPPYVLLDRTLTDAAGQPQPIRIGVIGFLPPQIMTWDRKHLEGNVTTRDILATARAYLPQMREHGADLIVALSHSGIGSAKENEGMENASVPLAALDIDALVTGHVHLVFPAPAFADHPAIDPEKGLIHGKPATMAGFWGSHLGITDLLLERDAGEWRVFASAVQTRPIWRRNPDRSIAPLARDDATVLDTTRKAHEETLAYVRRPVGRTAVPLTSYFAMIAPSPAVRIVALAQRWYVARMLRNTGHADLPLLSAAAPFKAGGRGGPGNYTRVPAGDIAIRNVADLYIYPNTVRAVRVTGAQLKGWLERAASVFNRIEPGAPGQHLVDQSALSYNFDSIEGVTYEIDLSRPPMFDTEGTLLDPDANRIRKLAFDGAPVAPGAEFIIATNSYRASGGGHFPGADGATIVFEAPDTNRDVLLRHIAACGTIDPTADPNWRFAPLGGTEVLFQSAPEAARFIDQPGAELDVAGEGAEGFTTFRLTL